MEQEIAQNTDNLPPTEIQTTPPSRKVKLILAIAVLVLFFLGIAGFLFFKSLRIDKQPSQTPSTNSLPTSSQPSALSEYAKMASRFANPATSGTGGVVPEPPRLFLKETERFAREWIKNPVKATYTFFDSAASASSSSSLIIYAAPNPFRWRVDYILKLKDTEYKTTYLYDGIDYSGCKNTKDKESVCFKASSMFLEKEIQPAIPLTEFLNSILDSSLLKKLMPVIENSGPTQEQKNIREIAGHSTECKTVSDNYRILEFCVAKETSLPLYLDFKNTTAAGETLKQFTLTLLNIDFSPNEQQAFTLP